MTRCAFPDNIAEYQNEKAANTFYICNGETLIGEAADEIDDNNVKMLISFTSLLNPFNYKL